MAKTGAASGRDATKSTAVGKGGATVLWLTRTRVEQLEVENHQLKSALTRAPEPSTIDNTHFF